MTHPMDADSELSVASGGMLRGERGDPRVLPLPYATPLYLGALAFSELRKATEGLQWQAKPQRLLTSVAKHSAACREGIRGL